MRKALASLFCASVMAFVFVGCETKPAEPAAPATPEAAPAAPAEAPAAPAEAPAESK